MSWYMPLVTVLRRQRYADLCGFEASLVYKNEFQDSQSYTEKPCLEKKKKEKKEKKM